MPDNFGTDRVLKVYKQLQKHGPEIFIPAPPVMHAHGGPISEHHSSGELLPRRAIGDRAKLNAKIEEEMGRDILEKPDTFDNKDGGDAPVMNAPSVDQQDTDSAVGKAPFVVEDASPAMLTVVNGEDSDPTVRQQRNKVKEVSPLNF